MSALPARKPVNRVVRASAIVLLCLVVYGLLRTGADLRETFAPRRIANIERFLTDIRPHPLEGRDFDWGVAADWALTYLERRGLDAALTTLALSVAAIVMSGAISAVLCLVAARTFATPEPFAPGARPPGGFVRALWLFIAYGARGGFAVLRALPEYVWAFLLLLHFGPSPWTAVLALVIHNVGILSRLYAETIENLPAGAPATLRGLGAGRLSIAAVGVAPTVVPRFLLYFFYRWETCVREATVLGMLGIVSLGYWIVDARARNHYDEMFLLVLVGAAIVILGDAVSAVARRLVRRAA